MKKLISLVIAVALVVCLLPVIASAEVVTGIGLPATQTGYVGDTLWLQPEYLGGDEWPADLVWTSSDPTIVEVSGSNWGCDCTLLSAGTATVTVTSDSLSASCVITAETIPQIALDTAEEVTLADYSGAKFQFVAPADGKYTIYVPETNGRAFGYAETSINYNYAEFSSDADEIYMVAVVNMTAGEICNIGVYVSQEEAANIQVKVINTPAATGYSFNEEAIEVGYMEGYETYTYAWLNVDPVLAGKPQNLLYKIKDETIATVPYVNMDGSCVILPVKPGETVLEAYDGTELIASVPVVVTDIADSIENMVWGVEYDLSGDKENLFYYTPSADDTFTFQSFGDTEKSDPWVEILKKDGDSWDRVDYFDDSIDSLNFKGEVALTKDTKYLIVVGNYMEKAEYAISLKGTAASDPGYDLKKVAAKPADCTTDGNIEYYLCQKTGIKFANETATKLAGDVVIKATGHKLDKVEATKTTAAHEKCSVCSALFLNGKEVKAADLKLDNPPTGDSTLLIPFVALVVLSTLGLGITAVARKRA